MLLGRLGDDLHGVVPGIGAETVGAQVSSAVGGVPRISTLLNPAAAMSLTSDRSVASFIGASGSHHRIFGRTSVGN